MVPRPVRYFVVCACVSALVACGGKTNNGSLQAHLDSAQEYLKQGQFNAADIEAKAALQIDPRDERAIILLARIYNELGMSREAIAELLTVNGTSPDYYVALARSYLKRGKYATALDVLSQHGDKFAGRQVDAGLIRAEAKLNLHDFDAARSEYQNVLSKDPGNVKARLGIATMDALGGKVDSARAAVNRIITEHPNDVDALTLLGALYAREQNLDEAERTLTRAIGALPTTDRFTSQRVNLIQTMIQLLARSGRTGEALTYQEMLAKAFPNSGEVKHTMNDVVASLERGDFKSALGLLDKVDAMAPGNDTTGKLRGVIAFLQGKDQVANQIFSQTVDTEIAGTPTLRMVAETDFKLDRPYRVVKMLQKRAETTKDPGILGLYGIAALSAGMYKQGEDALRRAISLDPKRVRLSVVLARHLNKEDPAAALTVLEQAHATAPADPTVRLSLLLQYFNAGKPEAARQYVEGLASSDPESVSTNLVAGTYYLRRGDGDRAAAAFNKAIGADPRDLNSYYGLAQAQMLNKDFEAAEKTYRRIIDRKQDAVMAYQGLLQTYVERKETPKGISLLSNMAQGGDSDAALVAISQYYAGVHKDDDAAKYLNQATTVKNSEYWKRANASLYLRQARMAFASGKYDEARTAIFSALSSYPANSQLLSLLAQIEIASGSLGEAKKVIDQMAEVNSGARIVNVRKGDLASAQGDLVAAARNYEVAWKQMPGDLLGLDLYSTYQGLGDKEKASKFLETWLATIPNTVVGRVNLAESYAASGDTDKAIDVYRNLLKHNPDSQTALNNLAWIYLQVNRIPEAVAASEKAYKKMPGNGSIADTYGWALFKANRAREAETILEHAAKLSSNPEIRSHLDAVKKSLSSGT